MSTVDLHDAYLATLSVAVPEPLPERRSSWWRWRDIEVHVETTRPDERAGGSAGQVLMLHGGGGNAAAMWPFAAMIAARGFTVTVPDLPGYGRTRVPRPGSVRYHDWVALTRDFAGELHRANGQPLIVVGASMGGMLGYEVAARTDAVRLLVATCLLDPTDPPVRAALGPRWLPGRVADLGIGAARGPLASLRVPIRWLTNMRAISNSAEFVELALRDRRGGGSRVPLGFLRDYLSYVPTPPERFTAPEVVLAHPAEDRWTPVELSRRFFDRIAAPRRIVMLEGAGHAPVERSGVTALLDILAD